MIEHSKQCFTTFPNTSKVVKNTPLRVLFSILFTLFGNVLNHGLLCLIYYWKRFTTYLCRRFLLFVVSCSPGSSPTFPQGLPFHLSSAQTCLWGFLRMNIQSTFKPFIKILFLILSYDISTDISHQLNWLFYLNIVNKRNGYEVRQTSKEQTKMPRFWLEGSRLCKIFCFVLIHYA